MRCVGRVVILMTACALGPDVTLGLGTQTAPSPLADIVKGLGADEFAVREAAQKELASVPLEQVDVLRAAEKAATDEEVKARLHARISEMELYTMLHPPPLSIDLKDASLADVAKALSAQLSGKLVEASTNNLGARVVTLKLKDQPLWEILRQVNEVVPFTVGLSTPAVGSAGTSTAFHLTELPGNPVPRPMTVLDGMGIMPQITGNPANANWALRCTFYLDPRIRVARSVSVLHVDKAVDQDGRALSVVEPTSVSTSSLARPTPAFGCSATFSMAPGVTSIREFRGTATVEFIESERRILFDLTKDTRDPVDTPAGKVSLEKNANGDYTLRVVAPDAEIVQPAAVPVPAGGAAPAVLISSALVSRGPAMSIRVIDENGRTVQSMSAMPLAGRGITTTIRGANGGMTATTIEITMADKTREVTLPIVLKDVPMSLPAAAVRGAVPANAPALQPFRGGPANPPAAGGFGGR